MRSSSAGNRRSRCDMSATRIAASIGGLVAVSTLMAAAVSAQAGASAATSAAQCDKSALGRLKTLSDPQRQLVALRPRDTTARAINERSRPRPTPTRRNRAFERHVWRVRAVILRDRLKRDGDIQLILVAGHSYLHAEFPAPACIPSTARGRATMIATRRRFERGCGVATRTWRDQGAVALVSGAGFWDRPNQDPGHAKNYAELHPVTSIKFLAGCDAESRAGG